MVKIWKSFVHVVTRAASAPRPAPPLHARAVPTPASSPARTLPAADLRRTASGPTFRRHDRQRAPHPALPAAAPPLPAPPRPTERPVQKEEAGRRGKRRLPSRSVPGAIFPVFSSRRRLCRQGITMCHCDCRPLSRCDCRLSSRCDCRPSCRCFL